MPKGQSLKENLNLKSFCLELADWLMAKETPHWKKLTPDEKARLTFKARKMSLYYTMRALENETEDISVLCKREAFLSKIVDLLPPPEIEVIAANNRVAVRVKSPTRFKDDLLE